MRATAVLRSPTTLGQESMYVYLKINSVLFVNSLTKFFMRYTESYVGLENIKHYEMEFCYIV